MDHSSVAFLLKVSLTHRKNRGEGGEESEEGAQEGGEGGMEEDGQGAPGAGQA